MQNTQQTKELSQEELLHYSRHIILPEIDLDGQQALKNSRVMIVGLGGLGSPVALYLAAAGVGTLVLIDDDTVESSNLQRQIAHNQSSVGLSKVESAKQQLEQINPWVTVEAIDERLTIHNANALMTRIDYLVDCSDNYDARYLLNRLSRSHVIPLISGTASQFSGQVAVFNQSPSAPCYQCLYSPENTNQETCETQGVLSPVVGVIGSLQATEVLKLILNLGHYATTTASSQLQQWDALKGNFKQFSIFADPECPICNAK